MRKVRSRKPVSAAAAAGLAVSKQKLVEFLIERPSTKARVTIPASPLRICSECRNPLLHRLRRTKTCSNACRMARSRRLRGVAKSPKLRFARSAC